MINLASRMQSVAPSDAVVVSEDTRRLVEGYFELSGLGPTEVKGVDQQLIVLRRKSPKRARLWNIDRLMFVWLYRLYPSLLDAIIIVQPETVIR